MKSRNKTDYMNEPVYQHDFFDTTSVGDFILQSGGRPPRGYPSTPVPDSYSATPFEADYEKRRQAFFRHCLKNPSMSGIKGYYYELVRLQCRKKPVHEGIIRAALNYIDERRDCADFVMLGIVRMLCQFSGSGLISDKLKRDAQATLLNFKYWPDEPGIDSMCTWTENHQIMFSCNEYLAGQMFPDRVFKNSGMTGIEKMAVSRQRIMKWLELRYLTGFSEWLSHVYYDEDLTALINLVDFCADPVIVRGAQIVTDILFLDMALNSFRGAFGSTHGRSYRPEKQDARIEATSDIQKLMFGTGMFSGTDNMSAVCFALSPGYRLPRVIYDIANDTRPDEVENRQRMGILLRQAERWGLDLKKPDHVMILLGLEAYAHPRTFRPVMGLFDRYRWWENQFFGPFREARALIKFLLATGLSRPVARLLEKDMCRNTREEVNTLTFRTPDYMLSSAQDYRPGFGGDQQHIWQATLSPQAVCFTTHPGHDGDTSAGYWVGSGTLPRVAQVKNCVIAVYRASRMPGIYMTNRLFFTHAWFPCKHFDEVCEKGGWIFGRKGNGYIALYSRNRYRWQESGEYAGMEVIADGRKNIWICEMGRKKIDKDFNSFMDRICGARLEFRGQNVMFESPSQGRLEFGWRGRLRQNGTAVPLGDYPRYSNPWMDVPFPPEQIVVTRGRERLELDPGRGIRRSGSFC